MSDGMKERLGCDPTEVHAVAGQLIAFLGERVAASPEVVVAALNVAAKVIDETRNAHFAATSRAQVSENLRRWRL